MMRINSKLEREKTIPDTRREFHSNTHQQAQTQWYKTLKIVHKFDILLKLLGTFENLLEPFGTFWNLLVPFGTFWYLLVPFETFWNLLEVFQAIFRRKSNFLCDRNFWTKVELLHHCASAQNHWDWVRAQKPICSCSTSIYKSLYKICIGGHAHTRISIMQIKENASILWVFTLIFMFWHSGNSHE